MNANVTEKLAPTKSKVATVNLLPLDFWQSVALGGDPEFFFENSDGNTVGSEKVLPKDGIASTTNGTYTLAAQQGVTGKTVIDGVQAELHPRASSCREILASEISLCFHSLKETLKAKGVRVVVAPLVNVSQSEIDSLTPQSQVFGCEPSRNIYQNAEESSIKVDAKKYLKRSAGGHVHLGNFFADILNEPARNISADQRQWGGKYAIAERTEKTLKQMPDVLVPILDIIVGNTCVLLDQDEGNIERRANYGRVGEFRIKPYGLEYRTLSNFWLKSYPLMSLVYGLARFAVHLVEQSKPDNDYVSALIGAVNREDIIKAINDNDFDLALANFKKIEKILIVAAGENDRANRYYPLKGSTMVYFYWFVKKGINYWFKEDVLSHWVGQYAARGGWEQFLLIHVKADLEASMKNTPIDLNNLNPNPHPQRTVAGAVRDYANEILAGVTDAH